MVKSKDCVLIARKGVVEVEVKDGIIVAYPKTQEAVREIIMEYVKALESEIQVDKAVLVGSYGRGCPDPDGWDDIDVVIVSPGFEDMRDYDRRRLLARYSAKAHTLLLPRGAYTPDEYNNRPKELGLTYYKRTGKVIYDKSRD